MATQIEYKATKDHDIFCIQEVIEEIMGISACASGYSVNGRIRDVLFDIADDESIQRVKSALKNMGVSFEVKEVEY